LENLKYAETVIAEAHKRTMAGALKWEVKGNYMSANLAGKIKVMIAYFDVGPDSAGWEFVFIDHPVGQERTKLGTPGEPKGKYQAPHAGGACLDQINQIF